MTGGRFSSNTAKVYCVHKAEGNRGTILDDPRRHAASHVTCSCSRKASHFEETAIAENSAATKPARPRTGNGEQGAVFKCKQHEKSLAA